MPVPCTHAATGTVRQIAYCPSLLVRSKCNVLASLLALLRTAEVNSPLLRGNSEISYSLFMLQMGFRAMLF